jgi:hypothetical protein
VGAAFSLWRAIFLTETKRDWDSISKSLGDFLERVVMNNTITYQDDKQNRSWTVGYYLGSAQLRLDKAWQKLLLSPSLSATALQRGTSSIETWNMSYESTLIEWQMNCDILCKLFNMLNPGFTVTEMVKFKPADIGCRLRFGWNLVWRDLR